MRDEGEELCKNEKERMNQRGERKEKEYIQHVDNSYSDKCTLLSDS
jgi:hypothetical protein